MSLDDPALLQESDIVAVLILYFVATSLDDKKELGTHLLGLMSLIKELTTWRGLQTLPFLREFGPFIQGLVDFAMPHVIAHMGFDEMRDQLLMARRSLRSAFSMPCIIDQLVDDGDIMANFFISALAFLYNFINAQGRGNYEGTVLAKEGALEVCMAFHSWLRTGLGGSTDWRYVSLPCHILRISVQCYSMCFDLLQTVLREYHGILGFGGTRKKAANAVSLLALLKETNRKFGGPLLFAGIFMQEADGFHMDGEWTSLEDMQDWFLEIAFQEIGDIGVIEALLSFWQHPDDPSLKCLQFLLSSVLKQEWPNDDE